MHVRVTRFLLPLWGALLAVPCLALLPWEAKAAPAEKIVLLVVVAPQRAEKDIAYGDVKDMFLGKRTHWASGDTVFPVLPPAKAEKQLSAFYTHTLATDAAEFQRQWKVRVARGAAITMPEQYASMKETLRALRKTGAIVVIPSADTERFRQYMKVLTVDGKKPTDEGYPLAFTP